MRENNPTVYSTEWGRLCPKCGKPAGKCICKTSASTVKSGDGIVRVQRDSKGRKGKTVTLISGVPLNEEGLRGLLSDFKRLCGAGGAIKEGVIEIQGDHRDVLFDEIKKRGYPVKKAGG
ncbi:MAG: translation initiation factor Sui1 [Anaerolineae bacterium]|nr:translation initiation factor Sui1 [Anaerolineae bacterium]